MPSRKTTWDLVKMAYRKTGTLTAGAGAGAGAGARAQVGAQVGAGALVWAGMTRVRVRLS